MFNYVRGERNVIFVLFLYLSMQCVHTPTCKVNGACLTSTIFQSPIFPISGERSVLVLEQNSILANIPYEHTDTVVFWWNTFGKPTNKYQTLADIHRNYGTITCCVGSWLMMLDVWMVTYRFCFYVHSLNTYCSDSASFEQFRARILRNIH